MKFRIIVALLAIRLFAYGQTVPGHPDLGLHGNVTWLSDTKIRVEYDWSSDAQLLDWIPTSGSTLVRGNGTVTIKDGSASVRSMIWKQRMKCTRIYALNARAINSSVAHLNFITNVLGWTGYFYNPPEMIGLIYRAPGNYWLENGTDISLPGPGCVLGTQYTIDINISDLAITAKSSSDNILYSHSLSASPRKDRQVALGGWEGDTDWGKVTIEGEITPPVPVHSDMIDIQSNGATFAPVIAVAGTPEITWIFDDSTTSTSVTPSKNYGSVGFRHNFLKVTPWSALIGINVGYDAGDNGYGNFAIVANQNVSGFRNLTLAKNGLQYICASYNPVSELDLTQFVSLRFVELFYCTVLSKVKLGSHPVLERICIEHCNVDSLELSGCPGLEDLRGALNNSSSINWGTIGQKIWHICIRDNPRLKLNMPSLTQFPVLKELLIWNDNQTGAFVCSNPVVEIIDTHLNHYTSANINGCTGLKQFYISGSQLNTLDLGTAANLTDVQLKDCGLTKSQVDYVLHTLDGAGKLNGNLELDKNAVPSAEGLVHCENLRGKGWNIIIPVGVTNITVSGATSAITSDNGTLQMIATVLPSDASDKAVIWSILSGSGLATISPAGLLTAIDNGTVTVKAEANDGSGISGIFVVTISNQIISVSGITIIGGNSITSDNGTLQLNAEVIPVNASNKTVTWSIVSGALLCSVNSSGLVTALDNGTVSVRASANDGSGVYTVFTITISNQLIKVTGIIITGATSAMLVNGTLQLTAQVLPENATSKNVIWSVTGGTGQASISATGLVKAIKNGTIVIRATSNDGSGNYGTFEINIEKIERIIATINNEELIIRIPEKYISANISLTSISGKLIENATIESNECRFPVSGLPGGIYIISIYKFILLDAVIVFKPW
jgi:uncharacterized protein YjdB